MKKKGLKGERSRLPDAIRAFILLDAMSLSDAQYDKVPSMATHRFDQDLTYKGARTAVKRL